MAKVKPLRDRVLVRRIEEAEQKVDITYDIKKGNLVYFNRINIAGNTKTRDKVIRRELAFTEGELYNSDKLKNSYARLGRLRYFEEVNFQTAKGPEENLTDINISVKERPTGLFSIGTGYSGQDGAMLMAQIAQQNLFGRGQNLSLQGALGTEKSTINLSFTEPYLFDLPLWMKTDLWKMSQELSRTKRPMYTPKLLRAEITNTKIQPGMRPKVRMMISCIK